MRWIALYLVTVCAEIGGCYCVYLWQKKDASNWVLLPAVLLIAAFVWLLKKSRVAPDLVAPGSVMWEFKWAVGSLFVLVAAPHTSNWDLPYLLAFAEIFGNAEDGTF